MGLHCLDRTIPSLHRHRLNRKFQNQNMQQVGLKWLRIQIKIENISNIIAMYALVNFLLFQLKGILLFNILPTHVPSGKHLRLSGHFPTLNPSPVLVPSKIANYTLVSHQIKYSFE
jgi:hypothetical protein